MSQTHEHFGKYILLEKLASGGMAEVFLARAPSAAGIAKFVAIKRILPQYSDNPDFMDMFKDEAKIAINLSHSNVVSIYEFGIELSRFFLVMEYVEGRNLRQILNKVKKSKVKLSIEQIVYVIKEVASGLDHAHRCLDGTTGKPLNITHRDMSPQNLMVSFEGEVKIVDFGIAKAESQMETTRAGTLKGKFGYMSPEQAEGQVVDLRTDIFSLGIVLWELLANDRLFMASNEMNTLRKIRECQIPSLRKINPNIHPEIERITMKALSKDRNMRYQTAAEMHRDMNRFLNRQFPDFSPQDFSVFIKSLYSDEIMETRRRLVSYSQIQFRDANETATVALGDATVVTSSTASGVFDMGGNDSNSAGDLAPPDHPNTATDVSKSDVIAPDGLNLEHSQPHVENAIAKTVVANNKSIIQEKSLSNIELPTEMTPKRMPTPPRPTDGGSYGSYRPSRPSINVREESPSRVIQLFLFAAILVIGYYGFKTFYPEEAKPVVKIVEDFTQKITGKPKNTRTPSDVSQGATRPAAPAQPVPAPQDTSFTDQASVGRPSAPTTATTFMIINSTPSGAEIYINGTFSGRTTPSRVEVPTDQKFNLSLRKQNYLDYERRDVAMGELSGKTFNATLLRAAIGYLDIDVKPSMNSKVYINGQLLRDERLPIIGYQVPANTAITIRALNPITGASSERTITLRQDERSAVVLSLKPGHNSNRVPANK